MPNDLKMKNLYFFVIILFLISSCDNEIEPIPAYVHVKSFIVDTNNNQGTSSSKITDVWVSDLSNGDFLGVYELPATFPLLKEGTTNLLLEPGIKVNGISATPDIYSMMRRYEVEVELEPNVTDTIQPSTTYKPDVEFFYLENFDNNNTLNVTFDTLCDLEPVTTDIDAFEGRSASFTLNENQRKIEVASLDQMEIPTNRGAAFLEMHYKTDGLLQVGLVGYEVGGSNPFRTYFMVLNPSEVWNKIYIDLTPELINSAATIDRFQILFGAQWFDGQPDLNFKIDNLKVIRRDDN